MKEYHKIETLFERDMEGNKKLIEGKFRNPLIEYLKDNEWIFNATQRWRWPRGRKGSGYVNGRFLSCYQYKNNLKLRETRKYGSTLSANATSCTNFNKPSPPITTKSHETP